jgi:hypothetical protein
MSRNGRSRKDPVALASLSLEEREVVRRSMQATFRYFDADFHTRLGVTPAAMRALLDAWPDIDDGNDDSDACIAINNAMNDLLHGVGISEEDAEKLIGVNRTEMLRIFRKWPLGRDR